MDSDSDAQRLRWAADRRTRMRTQIIGLKDDHEAFDRAYFVALSPAQKMAMVTAMFNEQWLLKGGDAKLLRLRRDIACLQRRRR